MAQKYTEFKTPFSNMSFTPDVPSSALAPTEYNSGRNVETDTRGIRAVFGDEEIMNEIPGTPIFVTGGYRGAFGNNTQADWSFIVATAEGRWFTLVEESIITEITPGFAQGAAPLAYTDNTVITEAWNGPTLFLNDNVGPPMFLRPQDTQIQQYGELNGKSIGDAIGDGTTVTYYFFIPELTPPLFPGQTVNIIGAVPDEYNGTYTVLTCTGTEFTVASGSTATYDINSDGRIFTPFTWGYNSAVSKLTCGFQRVYNTPNVGPVLIAGNLTEIDGNGVSTNLPVTVRWSQSFPPGSPPTTWAPTITNVANELELPVRGSIVDGFQLGGNFYVCTYWDTAVFNPIAYTSTTAPVLGVRLESSGRGLLNTNCFVNTDEVVYGLDARDIWVFDGNKFTGIGNQRVKDFFYSEINTDYQSRVFMQNNTRKNQIEIYYPNSLSTGWCNRMISYRYDLQIWNAPRDVSDASQACEAPEYGVQPDLSSLGFLEDTRTVVYSRGVANSQLVQKDTGTSFINNTAITSEFRRDNISLGIPYPQQTLLHRVYPEVINIDEYGLQIVDDAQTGNITVTIGGSNSSGGAPTFRPAETMAIATNDPWVQIDQNAFRVNSIKIGSTSTTRTWQCTAVNWQFTPTQDSR